MNTLNHAIAPHTLMILMAILIGLYIPTLLIPSLSGNRPTLRAFGILIERVLLSLVAALFFAILAIAIQPYRAHYLTLPEWAIDAAKIVAALVAAFYALRAVRFFFKALMLLIKAPYRGVRRYRASSPTTETDGDAVNDGGEHPPESADVAFPPPSDPSHMPGAVAQTSTPEVSLAVKRVRKPRATKDSE